MMEDENDCGCEDRAPRGQDWKCPDCDAEWPAEEESVVMTKRAKSATELQDELDRLADKYTDLYQAHEAGKLALTALRLHDAYLAVHQDRGGPNGPKGRAHQAWLDAKFAALKESA